MPRFEVVLSLKGDPKGVYQKGLFFKKCCVYLGFKTNMFEAVQKDVRNTERFEEQCLKKRPALKSAEAAQTDNQPKKSTSKTWKNNIGEEIKQLVGYSLLCWGHVFVENPTNDPLLGGLPGRRPMRTAVLLAFGRAPRRAQPGGRGGSQIRLHLIPMSWVQPLWKKLFLVPA